MFFENLTKYITKTKDGINRERYRDKKKRMKNVQINVYEKNSFCMYDKRKTEQHQICLMRTECTIGYSFVVSVFEEGHIFIDFSSTVPLLVPEGPVVMDRRTYCADRTVKLSPVMICVEQKRETRRARATHLLQRL